MRAAGRALEMGKPILAIKTGITAKSQAASQSHTGAIAGDYASYLAMCERYGVVNCRSLDDMVETALAFEGGRLPKGPRIGFITTSGGTVDLLYDYAEQEGAADPGFQRRHQGGDEADDAGRHRAEEPARHRHSRRPPPVAAKVCLAAANDPEHRHGGLGLADAAAHQMPGATCRRSSSTSNATDKPLIAFGRMIHQVSEQHVEAQKGVGLPVPARPGRDAACAQRALVPRRAARPRAGAAAAGAAERPHAGDARRDARALRHHAAEIARGGDRRRGGRGRGRDRLPGGAEDPLRRHPAQDRGRRRRAQPARRGDVEAAAERLVASARKAYPDARIDGFLVQEMASGIEAIVGARSDALYGPMLLVGAGGILVELAKDAALRMLPVTASDVTAMVDGLKLSKLLAGYRGRPAADRAALEKTVLALGALLPRSPVEDRRHRDQSADGPRERRRRRRRARAVARVNSMK